MTAEARTATIPYWRFLGNIELAGPDGDIAPALGRKPVAILAYLAIAGERVRRDEIAALLWPGPGPARGRHNLRQSLVTIRCALGDRADEIVTATDTWLELAAGAVRIDVRRLAEIDGGAEATPEEVLDLCRGPFLRGVTTRAGPFDGWASVQCEAGPGTPRCRRGRSV